MRLTCSGSFGVRPYLGPGKALKIIWIVLSSNICRSMSNAKSVFLSYSRDDWLVASEIQGALERNGYEIKWDQKLAAAEEWRDSIFYNIKSTGRTIVLWSNNSISSGWVLFEAAPALAFQKYVPISLDGVTPPDQFAPFQAPTLIQTDTFIDSILAAVSQDGAYSSNGKAEPREKLKICLLCCEDDIALAQLMHRRLSARYSCDVVTVSNGPQSDLDRTFRLMKQCNLFLPIISAHAGRYKYFDAVCNTADHEQKLVRAILIEDNPAQGPLLFKANLPRTIRVRVESNDDWLASIFRLIFDSERPSGKQFEGEIE
jgi:hypothetical protein